MEYGGAVYYSREYGVQRMAAYSWEQQKHLRDHIRPVKSEVAVTLERAATDDRLVSNTAASGGENPGRAPDTAGAQTDPLPAVCTVTTTTEVEVCEPGEPAASDERAVQVSGPPVRTVRPTVVSAVTLEILTAQPTQCPLPPEGAWQVVGSGRLAVYRANKRRARARRMAGGGPLGGQRLPASLGCSPPQSRPWATATAPGRVRSAQTPQVVGATQLVVGAGRRRRKKTHIEMVPPAAIRHARVDAWGAAPTPARTVARPAEAGGAAPTPAGTVARPAAARGAAATPARSVARPATARGAAATPARTLTLPADARGAGRAAPVPAQTVALPADARGAAPIPAPTVALPSIVRGTGAASGLSERGALGGKLLRPGSRQPVGASGQAKRRGPRGGADPVLSPPMGMTEADLALWVKRLFPLVEQQYHPDSGSMTWSRPSAMGFGGADPPCEPTVTPGYVCYLNAALTGLAASPAFVNTLCSPELTAFILAHPAGPTATLRNSLMQLVLTAAARPGLSVANLMPFMPASIRYDCNHESVEEVIRHLLRAVVEEVAGTPSEEVVAQKLLGQHRVTWTCPGVDGRDCPAEAEVLEMSDADPSPRVHVIAAAQARINGQHVNPVWIDLLQDNQPQTTSKLLDSERRKELLKHSRDRACAACRTSGETRVETTTPDWLMVCVDTTRQEEDPSASGGPAANVPCTGAAGGDSDAAPPRLKMQREVLAEGLISWPTKSTIRDGHTQNSGDQQYQLSAVIHHTGPHSTSGHYAVEVCPFGTTALARWDSCAHELNKTVAVMMYTRVRASDPRPFLTSAAMHQVCVAAAAPARRYEDVCRRPTSDAAPAGGNARATEAGDRVPGSGAPLSAAHSLLRGASAALTSAVLGQAMERVVVGAALSAGVSKRAATVAWSKLTAEASERVPDGTARPPGNGPPKGKAAQGDGQKAGGNTYRASHNIVVRGVHSADPEGFARGLFDTCHSDVRVHAATNWYGPVGSQLPATAPPLMKILFDSAQQRTAAMAFIRSEEGHRSCEKMGIEVAQITEDRPRAQRRRTTDMREQTVMLRLDKCAILQRVAHHILASTSAACPMERALAFVKLATARLQTGNPATAVFAPAGGPSPSLGSVLRAAGQTQPPLPAEAAGGTGGLHPVAMARLVAASLAGHIHTFEAQAAGAFDSHHCAVNSEVVPEIMGPPSKDTDLCVLGLTRSCHLVVILRAVASGLSATGVPDTSAQPDPDGLAGGGGTEGDPPAHDSATSELRSAVHELRKRGIEALWGTTAATTPPGSAASTAYNSLYLRCCSGVHTDAVHRALTDTEAAQQLLRDLGIVDVVRVGEDRSQSEGAAYWESVLQALSEDPAAIVQMWDVLSPGMGMSHIHSTRPLTEINFLEQARQAFMEGIDAYLYGQDGALEGDELMEGVDWPSGGGTSTLGTGASAGRTRDQSVVYISELERHAAPDHGLRPPEPPDPPATTRSAPTPPNPAAHCSHSTAVPITSLPTWGAPLPTHLSGQSFSGSVGPSGARARGARLVQGSGWGSRDRFSTSAVTGQPAGRADTRLEREAAGKAIAKAVQDGARAVHRLVSTELQAMASTGATEASHLQALLWDLCPMGVIFGAVRGEHPFARMARQAVATAVQEWGVHEQQAGSTAGAVQLHRTRVSGLRLWLSTPGRGTTPVVPLGQPCANVEAVQAALTWMDVPGPAADLGLTAVGIGQLAVAHTTSGLATRLIAVAAGLGDGGPAMLQALVLTTWLGAALDMDGPVFPDLRVHVATGQTDKARVGARVAAKLGFNRNPAQSWLGVGEALLTVHGGASWPQAVTDDSEPAETADRIGLNDLLGQPPKSPHPHGLLTGSEVYDHRPGGQWAAWVTVARASPMLLAAAEAREWVKAAAPVGGPDVGVSTPRAAALRSALVAVSDGDRPGPTTLLGFLCDHWQQHATSAWSLSELLPLLATLDTQVEAPYILYPQDPWEMVRDVLRQSPRAPCTASGGTELSLFGRLRPIGNHLPTHLVGVNAKFPGALRSLVQLGEAVGTAAAAYLLRGVQLVARVRDALGPASAEDRPDSGGVRRAAGDVEHEGGGGVRDTLPGLGGPGSRVVEGGAEEGNGSDVSSEPGSVAQKRRRRGASAGEQAPPPEQEGGGDPVPEPDAGGLDPARALHRGVGGGEFSDGSDDDDRWLNHPGGAPAGRSGAGSGCIGVDDVTMQFDPHTTLKRLHSEQRKTPQHRVLGPQLVTDGAAHRRALVRAGALGNAEQSGREPGAALAAGAAASARPVAAVSYATAARTQQAPGAVCMSAHGAWPRPPLSSARAAGRYVHETGVTLVVRDAASVSQGATMPDAVSAGLQQPPAGTIAKTAWPPPAPSTTLGLALTAAPAPPTPPGRARAGPKGKGVASVGAGAAAGTGEGGGSGRAPTARAGGAAAAPGTGPWLPPTDSTASGDVGVQLRVLSANLGGAGWNAHSVTITQLAREEAADVLVVCETHLPEGEAATLPAGPWHSARVIRSGRAGRNPSRRWGGVAVAAQVGGGHKVQSMKLLAECLRGDVLWVLLTVDGTDTKVVIGAVYLPPYGPKRPDGSTCDNDRAGACVDTNCDKNHPAEALRYIGATLPSMQRHGVVVLTGDFNADGKRNATGTTARRYREVEVVLGVRRTWSAAVEAWEAWKADGGDNGPHNTPGSDPAIALLSLNALHGGSAPGGMATTRVSYQGKERALDHVLVGAGALRTAFTVLPASRVADHSPLVATVLLPLAPVPPPAAGGSPRGAGPTGTTPIHLRSFVGHRQFGGAGVRPQVAEQLRSAVRAVHVEPRKDGEQDARDTALYEAIESVASVVRATDRAAPAGWGGQSSEDGPLEAMKRTAELLGAARKRAEQRHNHSNRAGQEPAVVQAAWEEYKQARRDARRACRTLHAADKAARVRAFLGALTSTDPRQSHRLAEQLLPCNKRGGPDLMSTVTAALNSSAAVSPSAVVPTHPRGSSTDTAKAAAELHVASLQLSFQESGVDDPLLDSSHMQACERRVKLAAALCEQDPRAGPNALNSEFCDHDVKLAIRQGKAGAATLGTSMTALQAAYGGDSEAARELRVPLVAAFNAVLTSGCVPATWCHGVITPVYKGGTAQPSDPLAYRSICVQPAVSKIFFLALLRRVTPALEALDGTGPGLDPAQSGFRVGRSTLDHLSTLHLLTEYSRLRQRDLYMAFTDVRRAYGSVHHAILLARLWQHGIRGSVWCVIRSWLRQQQVAVRVEGQLSRNVRVEKGLPEGAPLSPLLFLAYFEPVPIAVRAARRWTSQGGDGVGVRIPCTVEAQGAGPGAADSTIVTALLLADDVVNVASTPRGLELSVAALGGPLIAGRLTANPGAAKSAHMQAVVGRRTGGPSVPALPARAVHGALLPGQGVDPSSTVPLPSTPSYRYLGLRIDAATRPAGTSTCTDQYTTHRATVAGKCDQLRGIIGRSDVTALPPAHAATIINTHHLPQLAYGCSVWGDNTPRQVAEYERAVQHMIARHTTLPEGVVSGVTGLRGFAEAYCAEQLRLVALWCREERGSARSVVAGAGLRDWVALVGNPARQRGLLFNAVLRHLGEVDAALAWNDRAQGCEYGADPHEARPSCVPQAPYPANGIRAWRRGLCRALLFADDNAPLTVQEAKALSQAMDNNRKAAIGVWRLWRVTRALWSRRSLVGVGHLAVTPQPFAYLRRSPAQQLRMAARGGLRGLLRWNVYDRLRRRAREQAPAQTNTGSGGDSVANSTCPLCGAGPCTLLHAVRDCGALDPPRQQSWGCARTGLREVNVVGALVDDDSTQADHKRTMWFNLTMGAPLTQEAWRTAPGQRGRPELVWLKESRYPWALGVTGSLLQSVVAAFEAVAAADGLGASQPPHGGAAGRGADGARGARVPRGGRGGGSVCARGTRGARGARGVAGRRPGGPQPQQPQPRGRGLVRDRGVAASRRRTRARMQRRSSGNSDGNSTRTSDSSGGSGSGGSGSSGSSGDSGSSSSSSGSNNSGGSSGSNSGGNGSNSSSRRRAGGPPPAPPAPLPMLAHAPSPTHPHV